MTNVLNDTKMDALVGAAAMCGQPPAVVMEACALLLAPNREFSRDGMRVIFDANMLAIEIAFHTADAALVDVTQHIEGLGSGASVWLETLDFAESAHGTQGMWVGVRIERGIVTPTIAFDLEWWADLAVAFATHRAAECGAAVQQLATRFDGYNGHFLVAAHGGADPRFSVSRLAECEAPRMTAAFGEAVDHHRTDVTGAPAAGSESMLGQAFQGADDYQVIAGVTAIPADGRATGGTLALLGVPWDAAIAVATTFSGGEAPSERLLGALHMLGVLRDGPPRVTAVEIHFGHDGTARSRFVFDIPAT